MVGWLQGPVARPPGGLHFGCAFGADAGVYRFRHGKGAATAATASFMPYHQLWVQRDGAEKEFEGAHAGRLFAGPAAFGQAEAAVADEAQIHIVRFVVLAIEQADEEHARGGLAGFLVFRLPNFESEMCAGSQRLEG